jgi:LPS-assembly lipoprotein
MVKSALTLSVGLAISLLLTSCGFTLRGDYSLPAGIQQLQLLSTQKNAALQRTLANQLKGYNIQVLNSSVNTAEVQDTLDAVVYIQSDQLDRRLLSLFPTGQVAEYELVYTINYQIQFPGEDPTPMEFDVTREYQDDPDAVLAKSRELDLILSEMRQQAASRIIRQIASSFNTWQQTKGD